jgi:hypothetical protein
MSDWVILAVVGCAALALLFALGFAALMLSLAWRRNRQLAQRGVDVEGEVIERFQKTGGRQTPLYYITYRYHVPTPEGEKTFTATEQLWFFEWEQYQVGTLLQVRYLPENPSVALRSEKIVGRNRK